MIEDTNQILWHIDVELEKEIRTGIIEWAYFCIMGGNHMMRIDQLTQWNKIEQGEKDGEVLEIIVFIRQLEYELSMKTIGIQYLERKEEVSE